MNALLIILLIITAFYLTIYQPGFWKYFFGILIPYYILTQLFFGDLKLNSSKKKFFMSSWYHPFDSQIYCSSTIDVTKLLDFLKIYNKEHNTKIGPTIFLMKLLANIFVKYPQINGNIIFGNILKKNRIDVSVTVTNDSKRNTEVITIQGANDLSLEAISEQVHKHIELMKHGLEINLGRKKFFISILPTFLLGPFLRIISSLSASGLDLSFLGIPKYLYGTAVICNYGKEGLEDTFLPLFPFSYSPLCIGMSKIKEYNPNKYGDNPNVESGKKYYKCKFCYTMDHRFLNEKIVIQLLNDINSTILNPKQVFDLNYFSDTSSVSSNELEMPKQKIKFNKFDEKETLIN